MKSQLTPEDIARRVGRSGMRVRKLLRQMYPDQAPGSGRSWDLTEDQVAAVLAYFAGSVAPQPASAVTESGVAGVATDVPADWFWEGHVQEAMVRFLKEAGWSIVSTSDTAARAQGEDIVATRDGRRLVVEVKGYPSKGYRDPRRAGEVKRTNPTLQAKHWYADVLLHIVRIQGKRPEVEVAIALPEAPRYRTLVAETGHALQGLGIGLFIVAADGSVEQLVRTAYERDARFGWQPGDVEITPR